MKIKHYVYALFIFTGSSMLECMQNEGPGGGFKTRLTPAQIKIIQGLTPEQQEVMSIIIQQAMEVTLQSSLASEERLLKMFTLCKEFDMEDDCPTIKKFAQSLVKDTEEILKNIQQQAAHHQEGLPSQNNFSPAAASMPASSANYTKDANHSAELKARIQAAREKEKTAKTSNS